MARIVLTNAGVVIGGIDLSDHVAQVELNRTFDEVETTAFGDGGRTRVAGLEDSSLTLSFHQDFAGASVEATVGPLVGGTASFQIYANGTTVGTANPRYSGVVLVTEWSPIAGSVGDLLTADVTWPVSGTVTKATA